MNLKGSGRKRGRPGLWYYQGIFFEVLIKTTKKLVFLSRFEPDISRIQVKSKADWSCLVYLLLNWTASLSLSGHLNRRLQRQALGFTQPIPEMSTRNIQIIMFLGSKVRLVRSADNLPPSWADYLDNVGSSTSHNPIGLQGLLRG
jgi:hypothetical protein